MQNRSFERPRHAEAAAGAASARSRIKDIVEFEAKMKANELAMGTAQVSAKAEFQAIILQFAIQRRLDPNRVNLAMEQALAWSLQDPQQVLTLWKEGLRRASSEESRHPGTSVGRANTYQRALDAASRKDRKSVV